VSFLSDPRSPIGMVPNPPESALFSGQLAQTVSLSDWLKAAQKTSQLACDRSDTQRTDKALPRALS
jgi:hypothetical protein